jgi:hypothetical protein
LKLSKTSRIVAALSRHKKPDKEGLLKLSLTVFTVTVFSKSQNRHKWSQIVTNIKAGRHKKSQKELAKTRL